MNSGPLSNYDTNGNYANDENEKEFSLNTGDKMPKVGYGCWKVPKDKISDCIYTALKTGYRLIDEAAVYGNEKGCGDGIRRALDEGIVKREDLWVTSKLWNTFHRKENVKAACR